MTVQEQIEQLLRQGRNRLQRELDTINTRYAFVSTDLARVSLISGIPEERLIELLTNAVRSHSSLAWDDLLDLLNTFFVWKRKQDQEFLAANDHLDSSLASGEPLVLTRDLTVHMEDRAYIFKRPEDARRFFDAAQYATREE